jgi:peptidoglycan/xylan/chitin deacetylase (PgdA/CDA1 family)
MEQTDALACNMPGTCRMSRLRAFLILAIAAGVTWIAIDPFGHDGRSPTHREKTIALTFDDIPRGPGAFYAPAERTQILIDALRKADVRQAAFFANPGRIGPKNDGAARLAAYVAAGHVIADHTFSHRDVHSQSAEAFLADVDKAENWLKGRPGYRPWLRFPGLNQGGRDVAKRHAVLDGLAARGLKVAWVTVDGSDWNMERLTIDAKRAGKQMNEAALRNLYVETMVQAADLSDQVMRRSVGRSPPHVMLLHETDLAARYIGDLVTALRNDGWEIITVDQAYADPVYQPYPELIAANATLPEALGWAKHVAGPLYYDRNDVPVADALFAERVLRPAAPPSSTVPIKPLAALHDECAVLYRNARRLTPLARLQRTDNCRSGTSA